MRHMYIYCNRGTELRFILKVWLILKGRSTLLLIFLDIRADMMLDGWLDWLAIFFQVSLISLDVSEFRLKKKIL